MISTILVPWNMSYYIPLGGFLPIYENILSYGGDKRLIVPTHSYMYREYHHLRKSNVYNGAIDDELWWIKDLDSSLKKDFYNLFSMRDINFTSYLPGDIEFLHTAPITKGERPFIIYVDNFLNFFKPFDLKILSTIKNCYKKLLLKNCLFIISHNQDTLDKLSSFFNNPDIDNLLKFEPLEISDEYVEATKDTKKEIYTFISSKKDDLDTIIALDEVLNIIRNKDSQKYQFIFKAKKPTEIVKAIKELEDNGIIIWIETELSINVIERLKQKSDYILSPKLLQNNNDIKEEINFDNIFDNDILNNFHISRDIYSQTKLLLGEAYIEDIDLKWFNSSNSIKVLFYTGFGYGIKVFNTYLFITSKSIDDIDDNSMSSHLSRTQEKYSSLDERKYEVFSNPCQIMPYLHRLVDKENSFSYYMSRRDFAKSNCIRK